MAKRTVIVDGLTGDEGARTRVLRFDGVAPLALLGRWSLSFYMLHQPILIGALMAWTALRR